MDIHELYNELKAELESNTDGFFMITPSDDKDTLDDAYQKFNAQNDDQKLKADTRSMALYGMNNYDHYHILLSKIKKGTKDDELNGLEYNCHDKEIVKEDYIELYDKDIKEKIDSAIEFNTHTTGRVIIYPTKDANELESLYMKYMALDMNNRASSDNKAHELFGKTNREIYNYCKEFIIKSKNDEVEDTHSTDNDEVLHTTSLFNNDTPILSPEELNNKVEENYECFNKEDGKKIKAWRESYSLLGQGIKIPEYNKLNLGRINILRKAIYENNNDAIIQCGWIPGVEFNSENRVKASKLVRDQMDAINYSVVAYNNYIEESKITKPKKCIKCGSTNIGVFIQGEPIFKCKDCGKYLGTVPIKESASNTENKKAVSIVLVSGNSWLGKTIKKVQGIEFSHASISLDDDLKRIYSFNRRNGFNGLSYESMRQYVKDGVDKVGVYTFFVSDEVYKQLEKTLDNFNLFINKTKYSLLNLLTIPLNIPLDMDMKLVCSEFVDKLLKSASLDLTNKKSMFVSPKDFHTKVKSDNRIIEVFNGDPKNFDQNKIKTRIQKLKRNNRIGVYEFVNYEEAITEAKSFPIQFDNNGNLLLKNIKKLDFEQEYTNSHRLLMEYDKQESYEPMKFELAKMQFFITLLEKKIYKQGKDKSVKELKVRARFLNDFKKYLKIVVANDKTFNFTEYYEQSPFNDAIIQINNDTLKYSWKAIKHLMK